MLFFVCAQWIECARHVLLTGALYYDRLAYRMLYVCVCVCVCVYAQIFVPVDLRKGTVG